MADEKDVEKQEDSREKKDDKKTKEDEKSSGDDILQWIIMAVIVVVCAGAGFGLGRLLAATRTPKTAEPPQGNKPAEAGELTTKTNSQKNWYYDLEPVVANLDEPGVTRYVRATLTLEISSEVDEKKGTVFLNEKKPILTNWLTIYLAGLNIENIRGNRNLKRIQLQILDAFNEKLFPDAKPRVRKILFKEFAIQ